MVKGALKPAPGSSSSSASTVPTNITAGQNPADPLTQLNSSQMFGVPGMAGLNSSAAASGGPGGFNPFTAMGMPGECGDFVVVVWFGVRGWMDGCL